GSVWAAGNVSAVCYSNGTRLKTYDAENRLHSDLYTYTNPSAATKTSYGGWLAGAFWPGFDYYSTAQPATIQSIDYNIASHPTRLMLYHPDYKAPSNQNEIRAWLWDGDDRLLTCQLVNSKCTSPLFSLEGLGDYDPASGSLTVNDRDSAGVVVSGHRADAFRAWSESIGSTFISVFNRDADADACSAATNSFCDFPRNGKLTSDGWTLDNDTWQGVRTYDGSVGQWNTPDAYAGDVHDPMSQKPFMWNNNNPYAYSDPSGFIIEFHGDHAAQRYNDAIDYFASHHADEAVDLLTRLRDDPNHTFIVSVTSNGARDGMNADIAGIRGGSPAINWDSRAGLSVERGVQSPAMGLVHEAAHAWRIAIDRHGYEAARNFFDSEYGDREEKRVIDGIERRTAQIVGEPARYSHTDGISCTVTMSVTGRRC
ncbi:MAG: hypothetical protein M3N13_02665, partial [Candidatus Eremiobacteraeota bacterium]|nr:hypothetical protein [Candidatus Eremiobacteraeota bacterium]